MDTPSNQASKPPRWIDHHPKLNRFNFSLVTLVFLFFIVLFWDSSVVSIEAGHRGVYWSRFFGGTRDWTLREGTSFKLPWDEIYLYDIRLKKIDGTVDMLTKDGLEIEVKWSVRYSPDPAHLPELHQSVGPEYAEVLIGTGVASSMREVLGNFRADEIYAMDENVLLHDIDGKIKQRLEKFPVIFEDFLITSLKLPTEITAGIIKKLLAEQSHLSYVFRLRTEEEEQKRKIIEAEGIRSFEKISGISILKWRGIDATVELAKSPNSKIVIMGTNNQSLPLILNGEK